MSDKSLKPFLVGLFTDARLFQRRIQKLDAAARTDVFRQILSTKNLRISDLKVLFTSGLFPTTCLDPSMGSLPLHFLAEEGNADGCAYVLGLRGADPNVATRRGDTPLMFAAAGGFMNLAAELLRAGAAINQRNHQGYSPLDMAIAHGHVNMVTFLFDHGAVFVPHDRDDFPPVHKAIDGGHEDMVRHLLLRGLPIASIRNMLGDTCLHICAHKNAHRLIPLLIQHGAAIEARNVLDMTPLVLALRFGASDTIAALLQNGASLAVYCSLPLSNPLCAVRRCKVTALHLVLRLDRAVADPIKPFLRAHLAQIPREIFFYPDSAASMAIEELNACSWLNEIELETIQNAQRLRWIHRMMSDGGPPFDFTELVRSILNFDATYVRNFEDRILPRLATAFQEASLSHLDLASIEAFAHAISLLRIRLRSLVEMRDGGAWVPDSDLARSFFEGRRIIGKMKGILAKIIGR